jgi:hypothetical protein
MFAQNMGSVDRIKRTVLGLAMMVVGFVVLGGTACTVVGVVGVIPLPTGLISWCPPCLPFRFSTKKA